ncbi:MAG: hypothetical protein IJR90_02255 [Clostridia bacterium]|nr:hypothetical protein [Clostridia bacterium]
MADISFRRPSPDADARELADYLNYLADELEYVLTHLDGENMTEAYQNKEEK